MPVLRKKDLSGSALVFVTTTVTNWIPVFQDDAIAYELLLQLEDTTAHFDVSTIGYVIMPHHLHMILGFKDISQLSKFMKTFKSLSSRRVKPIIPIKFHSGFKESDRFVFWKRRFDDLIIYSEKQFKIKLEYIHTNPLRANLVKEQTDWQYSSAKDWLTDEAGIISIDKDYSCFV